MNRLKFPCHVYYAVAPARGKPFRGGGSPTSADVSGWIMQIKGIPLDMTSREQSHHEWTVNLRMRSTMHTALRTIRVPRGDCFRVSTRCSKPHSPAESRKARSQSNTISVTLNSGLLTAGRSRKYQLSLPVIRHPGRQKRLIIVRV